MEGRATRQLFGGNNFALSAHSLYLFTPLILSAYLPYLFLLLFFTLLARREGDYRGVLG